MKKLNLLLCLFLSVSVFAINPADTDNISNMFEESALAIDAELNQLNEINELLIENEMTFSELEANHSELVAESNLSPVVAEGMLDKHPDSPLGIPAFWWGFCLGWVGLLVVYLSMDEGSDRKEQVRNALYGCLISAVVGTVLYFAVIATIIL